MSLQVSEAKRAEICWTNYPRSEAERDCGTQLEISVTKFKALIELSRKAEGSMPVVNETQASETKCTEACWTNYTGRVAPW